MISSTYTGEIYGSTASTPTYVTSTDDSLGQEAFLKMFMAQLTNQNPLDPMDNTEFTAQLATFSQLEQLTKISGYLEGLETIKESVNQATTLGYLGKEVAMSGNVLPVSQGYVGGTSFNLESDAYVVATITNESDSQVTQLALGYLNAGTQNFQWDGTDSDGNAVSDGLYAISITAYDTSGDPVTVSDMVVTGLVTGYQKDSEGNQYLLMGDAALPVTRVLAVRNIAATSTTTDSSTTDTSNTTGTTTDSSTTSTDADSVLNSILEGLTSLGSLAALLL